MRSVNRMARVEWPAIRADVGLVTIALLALLPTVVALGAEGLNGARAKCGEVAVMWLNMVDGIGQRHLAHGATQSTERLSVELHETTSLPPSRAVQATMFGARCHSICVPLSEDCR
jgi:hypothetical protein